ncbi:MAG: Ig-like domain-containing protein [bacterium]
MRQRFRAVGLFALAIAAITCTDSPTGPGAKGSTAGVTRVEMAPSFSPEAARIYAGLTRFGFDISEVHIVLTAQDSSAKDTTIAFPANQDQITIEIPVPPSTVDQAFTALIELRNDQHVVLFSGTQVVFARSSSLPRFSPPVVVIDYTGPGKGTKTVTLSPPDTVIAGSASVSLRATGVDSAGKPVTNLLVKFNVVDATLGTAVSTSDATGTLTGLGRRGVTVVTAVTPLGVTGSSRITFVPQPARVVVVSGNGQTGAAGSALAQPLVVEVQATDNLPVPGATVTFRAVTPGGAVLQASVIADSSGRATNTLTLGKTPGVYQFEATSGALTPVSVTATATPAPAVAIAIVSGDAQSDSIGRTLPSPLVVKLTDQFGGPASGATVTWTRIAGNGTPGAATSVSAANGTASTSYTLGNTPGSDTVRASIAGVSGAAGSVLFSMKAVVRGPSSIAIASGGNQSGAPGTVLAAAIVARVADAQNVPLPNVTVTWSASGAGATLNPASSPTDANGLASTQATLGTTPGSSIITASVGALTASTQVATTGGSTVTHLGVTGAIPTSFVVGGSPVTLAVELLSATGSRVPQSGIVVTLAGDVTPGVDFATLTATSSAAGIATFTIPPYIGPTGSVVLTFTSGSLPPLVLASIPVVAGSGSKLDIATQPAGTGASGVTLATQPVVQLSDASGNPVKTSGVVITASVASGPGLPTPVVSNPTATTNGSGQATFAGLGISGAVGSYTLNFAATAFSSVNSSAIAITAGPANTIALDAGSGQTTTIGTAVALPPSVKITDASGNAVAGVSVTFNAVTSGSTVSNASTTGSTVAVLTNTSGIAQLAAWTMSSTAGPHALTATAAVANGSPVTFTATATAAGATNISKIAGDLQSAKVGTTVAIAPSVVLKDGVGNPVSGVPVTFTVTTGNGVVTGTPATTNASGLATVGGWQLGNLVGANSLTATAGALTTTFTATGTAGAPAALGFVTQPLAAATSGVALPTQPVIQLLDSFGNATGGAGVTVNAVITSGTGTLSNSSATTVAGGMATFSGLAISGTPGAFTLQFQSGVLTPISSSPITVSAGAAAAIKFSQAPTVGTGGISFSPPVIVTLLDASSNVVPANTGSVTLFIKPGTGTTGASLVGGGPITFVNGVATFAAASIDFSGTGYALEASTTVLNGSGGAIADATTSPFNIQPGTAQLLTTKAGRRISVNPVGSVNPSPATSPIFVVKNAQGTPTQNLTINLASTGRCRLLNGSTPVTTLAMTTDVNGEVAPAVQLPSGADGAGCLIKATGASFTASEDSSQIAVFPNGTSHVWTGAANTAWSSPLNWIPVIAVPAVPSSPSDVVFIPNYKSPGGGNIPMVTGPKPSMSRLAMDTAATVFLNGIGIDIGSGGVTGLGLFASGSIHLQATASMAGLFDILDIGQNGSCGSVAPMVGTLTDVHASVLNVRCKTMIDTMTVSTGALNVFPNAGQGWLFLSSARAGLVVAGNASFAGDSLWVTGGAVFVSGTTTFGGGVSWTGGRLTSTGPVTFASDHAFYGNVRIVAANNATFGGAGAGQQQFAGDSLTVLGDFTQISGTVSGQTGLTFTTSSDHVTAFAGMAQQKISFADPTTSRMSVLLVKNPSTGVRFLTNAQLINGTAQPRVNLFQGQLQIASGKTFTVSSGNVSLGFSTNLDLTGNILGVNFCSGRTTNSASITGSGLFNGTAYSALTCTP